MSKFASDIAGAAKKDPGYRKMAGDDDGDEKPKGKAGRVSHHLTHAFHAVKKDDVEGFKGHMQSAMSAHGEPDADEMK